MTSFKWPSEQNVQNKSRWLKQKSLQNQSPYSKSSLFGGWKPVLPRPELFDRPSTCGSASNSWTGSHQSWWGEMGEGVTHFEFFQSAIWIHKIKSWNDYLQPWGQSPRQHADIDQPKATNPGSKHLAPKFPKTGQAKCFFIALANACRAWAGKVGKTPDHSWNKYLQVCTGIIKKWNIGKVKLKWWSHGKDNKHSKGAGISHSICSPRCISLSMTCSHWANLGAANKQSSIMLIMLPDEKIGAPNVSPSWTRSSSVWSNKSSNLRWARRLLELTSPWRQHQWLLPEVPGPCYKPSNKNTQVLRHTSSLGDSI